MDRQSKKVVHIYPCVDGLLYAPIYMAIRSFRYRYNDGREVRRVSDPNTGKFLCTEWSFDEELTVRLYAPAARGDVGNCERVLKYRNSSSEIHIVVGDPMTALRQPQSEGRFFRLLGTFVNRIALWGVCNREPADSGKRRAVNTLIDIADEGTTPLYALPGQFKELELGFSDRGKTSESVVSTFIQGAFARAEYKPGSLGLDEVRGVVDKKYDITFTFAPWLIEALTNSEDRLRHEIVNWFQSVPYPFSGLMMFASDAEDLASEELQTEFLRHVLIGLAFVYRYKREANRMLQSRMGDFRFYGLQNNAATEKTFASMITHAFARLIDSDVFCESLENAWLAWDLALDAIGNDDEELGRTIVRRLKVFDASQTRIVAAHDALDSTSDFDTILGAMVQEIRDFDFLEGGTP